MFRSRKGFHRFSFILFVVVVILCLNKINQREHSVRRMLYQIPEALGVSGDMEHSKFRTTGFFEPIDLVVTWVNGSDPAFLDNLSKFNKSGNGYCDTSENRFRDWGTLRYCLRSVEKYANWIRHVYIVTNGQVPSWLNVLNPRVSIVTHSEIFTNKRHLPTFNSMAIETHIHRIPDLSEQFLYMNDDIFFADKVKPEDFYSNETGFKIRFAGRSVPDCSKTCKLSHINNGICDTTCNTSVCDWDGEDCNWGHTSQLSGLADRNSHSGAIMYTVFQYNKAFGYVNRPIPAHVPFFIDKALMNELQNRFPEDWEKTSASKSRNSYSFQYAFAYYHYLMRPQNLEKNGSLPIFTTYPKPEDNAYYTTGNPAKLERGLNNLLKLGHKKFVCLNDPLSTRNTRKVEANQFVINKFLKRLLPEPSTFEKD